MNRCVAIVLQLIALSSACAGGPVPDPPPVPAGAAVPVAPTGGLGGGLAGHHWTQACFPRCGGPDDYRANPYPRQCWGPYPDFYRYVPAGIPLLDQCETRRDRRTWWFLPTPAALRDALWPGP